MTCIPVRRGYWGNNIGQPHTVPIKVTGKCGSVTVRLIPAPRGAGIVAARVPKKVLQMAGIDDCYTASRGSTKTLGNFVKVLIKNPCKRLEQVSKFRITTDCLSASILTSLQVSGLATGSLAEVPRLIARRDVQYGSIPCCSAA